MLTGRRLVAEDGTPVVTQSFRREAESVPDVRRLVRATLNHWKLEDIVGTAELIASELASNAVRHAQFESFRVTLRRLSDDRVQVAVIDRSRILPKLADPTDDKDHGRGLAIVEALSQQWGVEPLNWGKRVWANLERPARETLAHDVPIRAGLEAQAVYVLIVVAVTALLVAAVGAQR
ncbi:ATP-binding protein [Streptomyces cadmiisoli]|uniref:ATP-binding protein n=1 Tax=Streptomyces cadmiisoli TaxID=2184053 RepID=UPI0036648FA2